MAKKKSDQFEEALKRLQFIVEKMEKGELSLEEAMQYFSEGVRLIHSCNQKLQEAEDKIQLLLKDPEGNWQSIPFKTPFHDEIPKE